MTADQQKLRLNDKDLDLLAALHEGRFLTTSLIVAEFYSHRNAANRRLKKLADAGYTTREQEAVTKEAIWRPTKRAVTALIKAGRLEKSAYTWKQGQSTLFHQQHEADVNHLRLAWIRGAHEWENVTVQQCLSGPQLSDKIKDRRGRRYPIRPDRFLQLRMKSGSLYYLVEVDRGTKTLKNSKGWDVERQLFGYTIYHRLGGFARRYGGEAARPEDWPFGVLITVPSVARRNNIITTMIEKMTSEGLPLDRLRGYALFSEAIATPYEPIWITEQDVQPILKWLETRDINQPLAASLPEKTYGDVRRNLGAEWLARPYWRPSPEPGTRPRRDLDVRDALIDALIVTGRLQRFRIIDETWD